MSATVLPLIPEVGVLALVPDNWSDLWQPRHQVLTRLARFFNVVWVNPAQKLHGAVLEGLHPAKVWEPQPDLYPGFSVYDPEFWLPNIYRPRSLSDFAFRRRLKHADHLLAKRGVRKRVLYIWRPNFVRALDLAVFDISCYHVDDEYSFSAVEVPIQDAEKRLLSCVTQVFVHSPGLMERKGYFNPNTEQIPNGVDFHAYAQVRAEPHDLAPIPKPRIGYTGWLKKHLDWPLLLHLSERHPDWSFVLVGPVSPHPEVLALIGQVKRRRNVYLLGDKSTEALASYPQHFDVCIMPYASNDYTNCIYPLKLHEYLAGGQPTVGTRIRSLENFAQVVTLALSPDEWSAAICEALGLGAQTSEKVRARQVVARRHDWHILVGRIARTMAQRLGEEYSERLEPALELGCCAREGFLNELRRSN
jgi:UDP-galactopyranose mutase